MRWVATHTTTSIDYTAPQILTDDTTSLHTLSQPNVVRYDKWMSSYDKDVQEAGYILPLRAAEVLFEHLGDNTVPANTRGGGGNKHSTGHQPSRRCCLLFAPQASVLDAGCGTGLIGGRLRELGFEGSVAGVDYSQGMLQACYDARGNSYTTLMVQDLNAPLPWLSGIFDAVICVGVLYPDQVCLHRTASATARLATSTSTQPTFSIDHTPPCFVLRCVKVR